ncbi:epithelial chloride channel -like [Pelobates cultripes]|uniref:Epithelial chloride channel -like n=1 Tax=Pelobates cultripes TaxID=61616 RepID=A0AAD1SV93_PELCU|nr:epithelial chloride channel -like [Pelobates cultripes]
MAYWNIFYLILTSLVLHTTKCSMVKVNNGGYEDIVIAINPALKEDSRIIDSIQNMVKEATQYLFQATKKRLFIRNVKILIPSTWSSNNYTKPTTETYDKADVIVADPYLKYGNDPYTLQYGLCGEQGRYIHLTPSFLLDDNLISVYGPRGRVLVHEWAHLRWGVFDEYSYDNPYYIHGSFKVEATRCSLDIFGINILQPNQCQGTSCPTKACNFDSKTGLYEEGCVFVPDIYQFGQESIMYAQALTDVSAFCDDSNHNTEAPNLHNRMCDSRSTWSVIMDSSDITSTTPSTTNNIPIPSFTMLQNRDRVVTLVIDVSGSMSLNDRIGRLRQAADVFLIQIIETNTYVGIVQFCNIASVISPLKNLTKNQKEVFKAMIPSSTMNERTDICAGIRLGIEVNKGQDGTSYGTELVLLTDGEDNNDTRLCFSDIKNSGVIIHVIAVGPNAEKELEEISTMTGGLQFLASDMVDANGLIDAFSGISAADGDVFKKSIQLESSAFKIQPNECLSGTVYIDLTVGNDTFFLVTWQDSVPSIHLQDPMRKIYTTEQFSSDVTSKLSRLEIPGTAERGPWLYRICNNNTLNQVLGIIVNSKAADFSIPPIIVNAHMNKETNSYPNPMVVYALVKQGLMPVTGVNVTAIIESDNGNVEILELLDNGAGADVAKNDGIYTRYFIAFSTNGRYSLKVQVRGEDTKSRLALPKNQAFYMPGYAERGTITMNAPKPLVNESDLQLNVGVFVRTSSGGSFIVSNVPLGPQVDTIKPCKITDLAAKTSGYTIVISWTATGDDLDQGTANKYDLRTCVNPNDLRNNFESCYLVNMAGVKPQLAGSHETFTFVPGNMVVANGSILHFALIAIDKVSQKSSISNIAQAAIFISRVQPTTTPKPTTSTVKTSKYTTTSIILPPSDGCPSGLSVTAWTVIVCAIIIVTCLIVCIIICITSCLMRKGKKI